MNATPSRRIPELDGIRGVAILLVISWHYFVMLIQAKPGSALAYAQAAGRLSWTGVDLFFVLSGFLIGGILIDTRDSPNYFRTFYARRFFRIVPLYAVWLVVTYLTMRLVTAGAVFDSEIRENTLPMWTYVLYLQNFWMVARNKMISGTWSLAIEEQFYLTLPLIVRFAPRKWLPWIVAAGIALAPIVRVLIYVFAPHHRMALYVLMPARMDCLLFGVLGALMLRSYTWRAVLIRNGPGLAVAIGVLLVGAGYFTKINAFMLGSVMGAIGFTWMAALYLALILFGVTRSQGWLASVLRWRWLGWVGTVSYGLYLFHVEILSAVYRTLWSVPPMRMKTPGEWAAVLGSLALTLAICSTSWIYFEKPLVQIGHRWKYGSAKQGC
jgi:peptidoglycan/LPS O-acetylase OafA/YrhL